MANSSLFDPWFNLLAAQFAWNRSAIDTLSSIANLHSTEEPTGLVEEAEWTTRHEVFREYASLRVLNFSRQGGISANAPTLILAPYALHGGSVADFAPGHSLVERLLSEDLGSLYLVDWRSAVPRQRFDSIDTHLAQLNVVVDDIGQGRPVALLGLCQGGWLAAAFAARFPRKVRALALVGAPVDIAAEASSLSRLADATPTAAVDEILDLGGGLLLGKYSLAAWPSAGPSGDDIRASLQWDETLAASDVERLVTRFQHWNHEVKDLPGVFYQQVFDWIFHENRLARDRFVALGETIGLAQIACPLYLLAARDDEIVKPRQLTALAHLVGTPADDIETHVVAGRHLSLFMGRDTLAREWPGLAHFLIASCESEARVRGRCKQGLIGVNLSDPGAR